MEITQKPRRQESKILYFTRDFIFDRVIGKHPVRERGYIGFSNIKF